MGRLARIMSPDSPATMANELARLQKRVSDLERRMAVIEMHPMGDQSRSTWGAVGDNAYYHRQGDVSGDVAGMLSQVKPWLSTTTRFSERLTSIEFVKATAYNAALSGAVFATLAGAASWLFMLPWTTVPACGIAGSALTLGVFILQNRSDVRNLVKAQASKNVKRQQEVRVQSDKTEGDRVTGVEFLYVAGVTLEQLIEFAPTALRTESLTINAIGGGGRLFTQGQAQALGTELELLGYATSARGPQGRRLTAKGRALFRGLAEKAI